MAKKSKKEPEKPKVLKEVKSNFSGAILVRERNRNRAKKSNKNLVIMVFDKGNLKFSKELLGKRFSKKNIRCAKEVLTDRGFSKNIRIYIDKNNFLSEHIPAITLLKSLITVADDDFDDDFDELIESNFEREPEE